MSGANIDAILLLVVAPLVYATIREAILDFKNEKLRTAYRKERK